MQLKFIKLKEVLALTAKSKSTTYKDIEYGLLTRPVRLGAKAVAWPLHEIEAVNEARLAGWGSDEIKQLVCGLHISRECVK